MKICITGANGFIGSNLVTSLKQENINVISLCRTPRSNNDIYFNLTDEKSFHNIPPDTTHIIHGAYATQGKDLKQSYKINIEGSRALFNYANKHNIKVIFISSCSAHDQALSFYGKSKYLLEQYIDATKHIIVRPGFVIGDGGIYKRLEQSIQTLKCVPLFWGGNQLIQTIHINDLCKAMVALIAQNRIGIFNLVNDEAHTMREFYRHIFEKLYIKPRFIKFPSHTTLISLQFVEWLRIPLPITSENLLGLKAMRVFNSDLTNLGIQSVKKFN